MATVLTPIEAYHNPSAIRPAHEWVDFFTTFDQGDQRQNGLEFIEGLWSDKLAAVGVIGTIAIIVTSIVWCMLGGDLQTVFTVMGFVLTLIAGEFTNLCVWDVANKNSANCIACAVLSSGDS